MAIELYKYFKPELIDKVLGDRTLRASPVSILNDPFEISPSFTEWTAYHAARMLEDPHGFSEPECQKAAREAATQLGAKVRENSHLIICFSESCKNLAMWSRYAKSHAGFVIGFDPVTSFFQGKMYGLSESFKVKYDDERPNFPGELRNATRDEFMPLLLQKSRDWEYEREWRMFVKREVCNITGKVDGVDCHVMGLSPFFIDSVIFGAEMPLSDREKIMKILKSYPRPVDLFEAKLSPTKYELWIDPLFNRVERED